MSRRLVATCSIRRTMSTVRISSAAYIPRDIRDVELAYAFVASRKGGAGAQQGTM